MVQDRQNLAGVLLLLLLPIFANDGLAQTPHPAVPRTTDGSAFDFNSCKQCHEAKLKGTSVHAAVQVGCDACHAVEHYKNETDIYVRSEGNELCYECHEDKKPKTSQTTLHFALRKEPCTTCHDPHSSAAPHLLKRAAEGRDHESNLCLTCHTQIEALLKKPTQHAAVDMGCATCHTTHRSEPAGEPEGIFHLNKPPAALCLECHGADVPALRKAHQDQPIEKANCAECHNPHGSDAPKLLNSFVHAPFAAGCDTCHAAAVDGKIQLLDGARRTLCLACHSNIEEQLQQARVTHTPAEMEEGCVTCHSPHAASSPRQLRLGPVRTCFVCHEELAEARATKQHLHQPVFAQGCFVCHQPHGGAQNHLLRAETNDLCMECHNPGIAATVRTQRRDKKAVELFGGKVEIFPDALARIPTIDLLPSKDKGHPLIPRHPVRGKYQLGDNMTCVTCHTPHAANGNPKLFVTESAAQQELCRKCHQEDKK
ncbi:MAG: hypothetical protein M1453_08220 [Acidobacteria bacterium]|nr:hypothetical protein [Acidobacteriota bacterium]MCL5287962.1 hypothetical protein [Acidobacteriota bacterium]